MWRVLLPLVMALAGPAEKGPELLYVRDGWVYGMESGRLWEGTSPTRCGDGSVVYVHEGDLWRDGVRIEATSENENSPSCVEDILYLSGGYIWRYRDGERTQLWRGTNPALSEDGRIAYRDWFQGVQAIYVRDGDEVTLTYMGEGSDPAWGQDGRLYLHGDYTLGYWDGEVHWYDLYGAQPCPTPEGLYYICTENLYHPWPWHICKDGEVVVEDAWQPAW